MMNHRLTITAGIAVLAASLSLYALLMGNGWMAAAIGAVATVAVAGTLTRMATIPAAIAATVAALVAIVPPLAGEGWLGRIGAVAVIALVAASATGARLPRTFAAPATYLACLVFYLNLVFAHAQAFAALIPTAKSLTTLANMPARASVEFRYSPPVTTTRPVEFVAAAGIGAVAILVDLLAVRLRRPAIAGLPLLLLFSVPVASSIKGFGLYQTLAFGVAVAAYLTLLSTDGRQRLRMWGRLVSIRTVSAAEEAGAGPDTRELAASGRRVGLAAVALAMVVPIVLVGHKPHDLFQRTNDGNGLTGVGGQADSLSPLLTELPRQLSLTKPQPVLTYRTDAAQPRQQYLQEYVLNYDPHSDHWLPVASAVRSVRRPKLPYGVPGLDSTTPSSTVHTTVSVTEFAAGPLPLPYAPVQISGSGPAPLTEATGSLMVFDPQDQPKLTFTVTSTEAAPTENELSGETAAPAGIGHSYGGYTGPDVARLLKIAQKRTAGAVTQLQDATDLQNWFDSGSFTYTTKPTVGSARGWLLKFLTSDRRGDCEQFAPAFAVLARLMGIPSRVVVGYTGGNPGANGTWQVTTADAHAWPELYFALVGWVRFEPTPNAVGDQGTASLPPYTQGRLPGQQTGPGGAAASGPSAGPSGKAGKGQSGRLAGQPGEIGGSALTARGQHFPVGIVVGVLVFLLLAWPAAGRWLTSRRRWITASSDTALAHAAWRELVDYLADYGLPGPPSESPRATAARLADSAQLAPAAREAATRISTAEERARYSLAAVPGAGLRADVARVRKAIAKSCPWPQRLRARLLPVSTLVAVRGGLQSANRALSWLDSPLPSMRRHSGRRPRHAS